MRSLSTLFHRPASEHHNPRNKIVRTLPIPPPSQTKLKIPTGFDSPTLKTIPTHPSPRSTHKLCPDPVKTINQTQISLLDPTGARTRLFSRSNPDRAQPGDILLVRLKNTPDPFAGVCLNIRQRHHPVDTAILLRNTLTRVGVEMWFKIYSPNVEGVEIVQRKEKRARRAKLYYMRHARHDVGSLEGVVRGYLRQRVGGGGGKAGGVRSQNVKGRDANSGKKKSGHRGRNLSR